MWAGLLSLCVLLVVGVGSVKAQAPVDIEVVMGWDLIQQPVGWSEVQYMLVAGTVPGTYTRKSKLYDGLTTLGSIRLIDVTPGEEWHISIQTLSKTGTATASVYGPEVTVTIPTAGGTPPPQLNAPGLAIIEVFVYP